jgi:hypothetical protein
MSKLAERMTLRLPDGSNQVAKGSSNIHAVISWYSRWAEHNCFRSKWISEKFFNMKCVGGMG